MSAWERIKELPLRVESYELSDHDREYGDFTRPSTIVHLHGEGKEGIGEDVVYDVLDHIAHRDAGPVHELGAPKTLGEFCDWSASSTSSPAPRPSTPPRATTGAGPMRARRSTSRCARPGSPSAEVAERDPTPLQFVCSTRLSSFEDGDGSSSDAIRKRLDKVPGARVQARPRERLGRQS